eukprot:TRINITY_DN5155_c0_g1_i1.p1 TRINITY_DN5155_c0_g1~~TRINITY_DN5155_c0_g1_i1.p1  ORF type:complete len:218 (+),score=33.50 TRINITY_DN5155_c0_g1_i1:272-925(+)
MRCIILYSSERYHILWLSIIDEKIGTGKVTDEFELDSTTHQKLGADLIVMHLKEEDEFISKMEKYNTPLETVQLEHHEILREQLKNKSLTIIGHHFTTNTETKEEVLVPTTLEGTFNLYSNNRYFINTVTPSMMGVCGGPVVYNRKSENGSDETICIGMVEALIPELNNPDKPFLNVISNNTMVVPSSVIQSFLSDVEQTLDSAKSERFSKDFIDDL